MKSTAEIQQYVIDVTTSWRELYSSKDFNGGGKNLSSKLTPNVSSLFLLCCREIHCIHRFADNELSMSRFLQSL